jgi:hypothetical protein
MRALTIVRRVLTKDVPEIFSGTVEVDETYLGGQWKNKRKSSGTWEQNVGEVRRNNKYLESYVVMVKFGQR